MNENLKNTLSAILETKASAKLPHSLLFVGPGAVGEVEEKREAAKLLACSLLCSAATLDKPEACAVCTECLLVLNGNHPDFINVDCTDKDQASVKSIRELLARLSYRSFHGRGRVVILRSAHDLSAAAHNALLKTLEEPLPNTYFILLTENLSKLPITVVSRCQRWFFSSAEVQENLATLPEGIEMLLDGAISRDEQAVIELCTKIHKSKEDQPELLACVRSLLRKRMIEAVSLEEQQYISKLLQDFISAEYFISERNSNSHYALSAVFLSSERELATELFV